MEVHTVLRKIFGPKRNQVTGAWRRLHNEELDGLFLWPNLVQIKKNETGGAFGTYGRKD